MQIKQGITTALILFDQSDLKDVQKAVKHTEGAKELGFYIYSSELGVYRLRLKQGFEAGKKKKRKPTSSANKTEYTGVIRINDNRYRVDIRIKGELIYLGHAETDSEAFQIRLDYIKKNNLPYYKNGKRLQTIIKKPKQL